MITRIRARCNRRSCQARKTFRKPLNQYVKWPRCHVCKKGKMYEDKFRNGGGEHRLRPSCNCDGYSGSIRNAPHTWGSPQCKHREDYLLEMAFKRGTSRHSPRRNDASEEPGF